MPANGDCGAARDRVVDETLDLIEGLDLDQARSILRCFAIDEENFDTRALATVAKTVCATCHRSKSDYDAMCHFSSGSVARLNREHLLKSLAVSAEAKRAKAPQAAEHAQKTTQSSPASEKISNIGNTTDDQQQGPAAETLTPDLGDLEFEKLETRRLMRDGHVTINHYYVNQGPEVQQELKAEPQPLSHLCAQCNDWYFETDNVLQEDGRPPCGYHTGQVVYYGATQDEAWRNYGCRVAGWAWNCCRRRANTEGCNATFHRPA